MKIPRSAATVKAQVHREVLGQSQITAAFVKQAATIHGKGFEARKRDWAGYACTIAKRTSKTNACRALRPQG